LIFPVKAFVSSSSNQALETNWDCEHAQLAIEKRLRATLAAGDSQQLDAHLHSCADCRRFEDGARLTQSCLDCARQDPPTETLRRRWLAGRAQSQRRMWGVLLVALPAIPAVWAASGSLSLALTSVGIVELTLLGVLLIVALVKARMTAKLSRTQGDFFSFYRRQVEARIRRMRGLRVFLPLSTSAVLLSRLSHAGDVSLAFHRPVTWFFAAGIVVSCGASVFLSARVLPRLERELSELVQ
jgi:hypothetical protein